MRAVTREDIRHAVRVLGLSGLPLCVHSSLRSFGTVEGGAQTVIDALLDEGCTVLVPTFSYRFQIPPPLDPSFRPLRNGYDYTSGSFTPDHDTPIFATDSQVISQESMGAVPAAVLAMPEHRRGNHPANSLAAVGPLAAELIAGQTPTDVYAPFRRLAELRGWLVLMGVGLTRMTMLHLAEQQAGRTLFRRWALDPEGRPAMIAVGSCSEGFGNFEPVLSPIERTLTVGDSVWRAFPAAETLRLATEAIPRNPEITHCQDVACERCRDAISGGPILNP